MSAGHQQHADHPTTVALQRRLTSPRPLAAVDWQTPFELLVASVAEGCETAGARVIGHVKAFAVLPGGYARASAVDTEHEPTSDARASASVAAVDLTVNVLVYGLPAEGARRVAEDSLARIAGSRRIAISTIGKGKGPGMSSVLTTAISDLEEAAVLEEVRARLAKGDPSAEILDDCREGMAEVGRRFEEGEYFISDLMMAGHIFKQATALLGIGDGAEGADPVGTIVMGTVKGDVHDIGKDLVVGLLRAANYKVTDLGIDVPAERFVDAVRADSATIVGLSGLLTTSFEPMRDTVAALADAGLRDKVKVMIGGGPVTEEVCKMTGADGWSTNAQAAVSMANNWV